jgi:23S rRNA (adenine2503-C2)-methyltransferase
MHNLLSYTQTKIRDLLVLLNEKPFHASQIMRWIHRFGQNDFRQMNNLSHTLQDKLSDKATVSVPRVLKKYFSDDGTCKWLFEIDPTLAVETVFIPEIGRGTLCLSSQVGCALKCAFCATGHQGFSRNLTAAEIIGQLWWAKKELSNKQDNHTISNVVFMGMGEPLANFNEVIIALEIMLDDHAYGLSKRRVVVSTAGMVPQMAKLARTLPVSLAVSLHASNDTIRNQLVPLNKKYPLATLMHACQDYLNYAPRNFITFEYVMLANINDQLSHAKEIIQLLANIPCKINLIPFNPFALSNFSTSKKEAIRQFRDTLQEANIVVTIRKTRGQDIDAACGQLAGKFINKNNS